VGKVLNTETATYPLDPAQYRAPGIANIQTRHPGNLDRQIQVIFLQPLAADLTLTWRRGKDTANRRFQFFQIRTQHQNVARLPWLLFRTLCQPVNELFFEYFQLTQRGMTDMHLHRIIGRTYSILMLFRFE